MQCQHGAGLLFQLADVSLGWNYHRLPPCLLMQCQHGAGLLFRLVDAPSRWDYHQLQPCILCRFCRFQLADHIGDNPLHLCAGF